MGGVKKKFNSGVRYSQWAINSRANDFYANTTPFGLATYKADGSTNKERKDAKKKLDYVPGLVAKSMIEAADYYQGFSWSKPWFLSVKEYGDTYCQKVPETGGSLDDLNAVKLYIGLFNNTNATKTDKSNYKNAISSAQKGLIEHDKNNSIQSGTLAEKAGNTVLGGWFHKEAYNNQMWLDGAYMGSALLAQIVNFNKTETGSSVFGSTTADWDMVFKQLNIVWNMCWNSTDGLMYHAFEANAGTGTSKSHADTWAGLNGTKEPYTFHSAAYWGRANAWYLMALVDVLEAMKKAGQENTDNYTTLKQHLADLAAGIAARQDSKTGGWYQVMDKDASFTASSYNSNWTDKPASVTNYIETSATAIFAAAYFKAVRCGLLESTTQYDYKTIAKNAFEGLVNNYTYLDNNGDMQIWGSCRSAGLGGDGTDYVAGGKKYRNGSKEYYLLGYDVPMVKQTEGITEGKVLGGFIMAATEYERAYQNQDSKQILFAKDLAPSYDISTSTATLDATAYGDGTVSYQWYKSDGTEITNATNATYAPTESGEYYCKATANDKTITTSKTTVTTANTNNGSTDNNGGSDNGTASEGTVTFSGDQLKNYSSPMADVSKVVTIKTSKGTIKKESSDGGDIKVAKDAAFTISVAEGKYIKSITYTIKASKNGELTFDPTDKNKVTSSDNLTYTYNYSDNKLSSVTATNSAKGGIQVTSIKVVYGTIPTENNPTESGVIYDFTTSVGTTSYGTSCTSTNGIITFSSNFSAKEGKYITITPKAGGFKAGDMITLKGYCDSKNLSGVIIYSDVNGSSIFKSNVLAKKADGGSEFTYTIEKDCDALYLGRYGGGTTCLTSLKVERPASSSGKTRLTAFFKQNADVVVNTTPTVTLPALTVKAGETALTADKDYTVVYTSNAEDVASLSGNTITINSLGIATITATVTPKNTDTYEGTTATYQLSVKAPSPLNVSVKDVTINTTDAEEEQPVIKVYGDNDKLLKLGQDYTLSYTVSGNNVTVDNETGKFSVKKNEQQTEFIKGTSLITVTATPTSSLGSNYIAGTLQFSYSVSEGKIKPVFLKSFNGITINLHLDATSSKEITVPLIHDGEDVSSYFNYTYTVTPTGNTSSVTGSTLNFTPKTAGTYTVTVSATPGSAGTDDYSDVYDNPDAITFTLNVASNYEPIIVTPESENIKMYAGNTQVAPDLTVTKGTTTLGYTEYNVTWFSTSPGVVKVDASTGKIEAVSEGTAEIRVVVSGENLESTTALITVDVDDPAVYRVKSTVETGETYGNHTTMWNQDKTLSVTLGGWMFPNDGTPDTKILNPNKKDPEKLSNNNKWDTQSSKAKWKLTGFDYYVTCNNNKNARQENGSNAMPETTLIGSADFKKYTTEVKDPMFNVPCSGSFLVFNPKTNGKVTAHIFQNGVFDASGETKSYRPQRRVFIMDEAGNFVTSTAHIESTTGKPTGGVYDLTKYGWDLNGGQAPTETDVANHFDGLESFVMTKDGFKNNVYPSALSTEIMPNNAIANHQGEKSAHGWCVLADSPVTYTFNVKAGKTYYLYNFGSKIGFYGFSFDEDETTPIVDGVNYNADDANANNVVEKTPDGHVAQVKIVRQMVANRWTTCVLPFSLNKHQVDAIFGATYSIDNKEGTQILYFDHVEGNKAYFVRHAYNTIVAGKPFLIKPTKEVTSINTAEVTDYPYVTIENTEPNDWCESNGYVWTSSYNKMNIVKNDYFIGASDGKFKAYSGDSGIVKGFRGFLKADHSAGAKPTMLSISTSSITDGNEGETTGIEDLIITVDGELMPANSRVYNINGQLVSEDASNFQSLPSGIYIINGKKYIK